MLLKKFLAGTLLLMLFIFSSCSKSLSPDAGPVRKLSAQPVLYWNEVAYNAFGGPAIQHSLAASRLNAMVHLAIHDALNGIESKYSRWAFSGFDEKADAIAATASAAYQILLNELPERKSFLDSAFTEGIKNVAEGEARTRGIELGKQAAQAVLTKRANDGSVGEIFTPVPESNLAGVYQAVQPFPGTFAVHWVNVKTFGLQTAAQFRPAPYPALNSTAYATAFNEVKETGKLNSTTRTADQSAYAKFWYEFSEAGWNRVARVVVVKKNLNLLDAARVFALVDIALADSYIAGWEAKAHYNFWRPFTAIRKAAIDANDATAPDATWEPSEVTPPVQDYPSTHSALGKSAATVLASLLGDNTAFSMTSPTAKTPGEIRSFTSFTQAADENADSRVRAGIHFRFSCEAGKELGGKIGKWVVDNHLRPIK